VRACYVCIIFWLIALAASLFYGLKACDAFGVPAGQKPWAWKVHQFWFNFVGSLVGWYACWILLPGAVAYFSTTRTPSVSLSSAIWAVIAFVGITGHIPFAVAGLLQGIIELAKKVTELK